jgi:hypothetical protein
VKGVVFNLLEEFVRRAHGEDVWDALLARARLEGAYTSLGNYADEDLGALVGAASQMLGQPPAVIVRTFGRQALPMLAEKYPNFFRPFPSTRPFLLALNEIIHPEVNKLYRGAETPEFDFDATSPDVLVMGYASRRRLCEFAQGLIEGAAAHYGEEVAIEQTRCMDRGDLRCEFHIALRRAA